MMSNSTLSPTPGDDDDDTMLRALLVGSFAETVLSVVLSSVNIILHSFGAYLLYSLYKSGSRTVQSIFLINLSILDFVLSCVTLADDSLDFIDNTNHSTHHLYDNHDLHDLHDLHDPFLTIYKKPTR